MLTGTHCPAEQSTSSASLTEELYSRIFNDHHPLKSISYHLDTNSFDIHQEDSTAKDANIITEDTIPYFPLENITNLLNYNREDKLNYDTNIRTIRLVRDHFERVDDPDSFISDEYEEGDHQCRSNINV